MKKIKTDSVNKHLIISSIWCFGEYPNHTRSAGLAYLGLKTRPPNPFPAPKKSIGAEKFRPGFQSKFSSIEC